MLYVNGYKVPNGYIFVAHKAGETEIGLRELVTSQNYKEFEAKVAKRYPGEGKISLERYFRLEPSVLAHQIPDIQQIIDHPVTKKDMALFSIIMDLNDKYEWSREKIADWLETLDNIPTFKKDADADW